MSITGSEAKRRREAAGVSQQQLAAAVGIHRGSLSNWENGHGGLGPDAVTGIESRLGELENGGKLPPAKPTPKVIKPLAKVVPKAVKPVTSAVDSFVRMIDEEIRAGVERVREHERDTIRERMSPFLG